MVRENFNAIATPILLALLGILTAGEIQAEPPCTAEQGQIYINNGSYGQAITEFSCIINAQPTGIEGYRGRIEAELLLGEFSNAVRDYARIIALVLPVHPDAKNTILAGYAARLAVAPDSIPALTGASGMHWWFFEYAKAIHLLNHLLAIAPNQLHGNLLRGSSRLLSGATPAQGVMDLERAIILSPANPHVRFIVADAYTYGQPNPSRAFAEAKLALNWGLDTPRIRAILANAYAAFGNPVESANQVKIHFDQVTTQLIKTSPLSAGGALTLGLVPGRTYEIPLAVSAGEKVTISTSSRDFFDTILVVLAPDGSPVVTSDDHIRYFAGLNWVPNASGVYRMLVTSFESVNTGDMQVKRK
jgi:tetratricopeptide (TPR) repeat protein